MHPLAFSNIFGNAFCLQEGFICMEEKDFYHQIEKTKAEWHEAFKMMQKYYESEVFKSFKIKYDASTWYRFKNPAHIYPAEREMMFSTPNSHINFDYYPSFLSKLCITAHNFAYLADIEEYYRYADMADALRRIYGKGRTAYRSYI